jgi:membrane associated rhomboid family serine protease
MVREFDDARPRRTPIAVGALIAVNAIVFCYEMILSGGPAADGAAVGEFVATWGLVPREFFREIADPGATRQVVWLTPISSMFLHGGLIHLASNLLYLWVFGAEVEDWLGSSRFLVFYLACGLAASGFQVASDPDSYVATIGASGAISGVLGAYVVSYPHRRLRLRWPPIPIPAAFFLLVWIVIQVLTGFDYLPAEEGGTARWAHTGGFLAGIALARSMRAHFCRAHDCASDRQTPSDV